MKRLLLTCVLLACPFLLQANPYEPYQQHIIPSEPLQENIVDVTHLPNTDLLVTFKGSLYGDPVLGERFGVAKLESDGTPIWVFTNQLPHNGFKPAASVGTADGGAWLFAFPDDEAPTPGLRAFRIDANGAFVSTVFIALPFQPTGKLDAWPIANDGVLIDYRVGNDPTVRLMRINTAGQIVWQSSTPIRGDHKLLWQDDITFAVFGLTDSTAVFVRKDINGNTLVITEIGGYDDTQFCDAYRTENGPFYTLTKSTSGEYFIRQISANGALFHTYFPQAGVGNARYLAPLQGEDGFILISQGEHEPAFGAIPSLVAVNLDGDILWRKYVDIDNNFGIDFGNIMHINARDLWMVPNLGIKLLGIIHDKFTDPQVVPTFQDAWISGYFYDPYAGLPLQLDVVPAHETVQAAENASIPLTFNVWNNINQPMDLDVWYEYGWYQGSWDPMIVSQPMYSDPVVEELIVPAEDFVSINRTYTAPDLPAFVYDRQVVVRVTVGIYPYQVFAHDYFSIDVVPEAADIAGDAGIVASSLPTEYALGTVYPNPFNSSTRVRVTLSEAADLRVNVYDLTGRLIASLADGVYPAGVHDLTFKADHLASGVYFLRATIPGQLNATRKLVLVR